MRMANGTGGVTKLKGNRRKPYHARITKGWTDEGKQIYSTIGYYEKRQEALDALYEYRLNPYDIGKSKIMFKDVYEKWSESHFEKISEKSTNKYKNAFRTYCKKLHDMRFVDIRLNHLQRVIDESNKEYPTKRYIKTLLNELYRYAIKNDIVEKNYASYIEIGKYEKQKDAKVFTTKEIDKMFKYVNDLEYLDTILILIFTGLRIQEMFNIKIKDVHIEERYIKGGLKTEAGKNRIIPINKKIEPFIKRYYEKNKDKEYLITNSLGKQMKYANYRREKWNNIMEQLNLDKNHHPHECRHTFASMMDSSGANKLCIKRIMGHASQDITDSVYTHKTIEELIEAIDLI